MRRIYLDYQATTPVDQRVIEAMLPAFCHDFGNPSQKHCFGMAAKGIMGRASRSILKALGAEKAGIVFNSGATESNNMAIFGVLKKKDPQAHIILPATEHSSVLELGQYLAGEGRAVTFINPDSSGVFSPAEIESAITEQTVLLSVMAVNNEIGVIQPLAEIGQLCRRKGILFHCDATQAIGRIAIDMSEMCIDLLSISAHKFYGPKGVGALIMADKDLIAPCSLMHGGGQQNSLRPGTINVSGIAGMEKALLLSLAELETENRRLKELSRLFWERLSSALPEIKLNGSASQRISSNLNVTFPGIATEALMMALPEIAFSAASACNGEKKKPSHVLKAIGLDDIAATSSARFSFGRFTTEEEIIYATDSIIAAVLKLQPEKKPAETAEKLDILPEITEKIDLRHLKCPENYSRMMMKLESLDEGEVLSALVTGTEAKNNVLANLEPDGYRLLRLQPLKEPDWEFIIQV
jgi:cysteine desulfurase